MKTMYDVDLKGKTVLVRVDLNTNVTNGFNVSDRFIEHAKTVKELIKFGAKIVLLSHQGRPGKKDFTSLRRHARELSKLIKRNVKFVPDLYGDRAIKEIRALKNGDVLLLENVRFYDDEFSSKPRSTEFVKRLQPLIDYFILDAFSVSHRKQTSVVGFRPALAGRVLLNEICGIENYVNHISHPHVVVIGGGKVEEPLDFMLSFKNVDNFLVGGATALSLMSAQGFDVGHESDKAKKIIKKHEDKIVLPLDLVCGRGTFDVDDLPSDDFFDIGAKTIKLYEEFLKKAKTVLLIKPLGVYEKKKFENGTRRIFKFVSTLRAKKFAGGGDTVTALKKFNVLLKRFDYVSLSGGAFLAALSGKKLPGLRVLGYYR